MFTSKLRFYSVGLVAIDKPLDTHEIQVMPIEVAPFFNGEVADLESRTEVSGLNARDEQYTVTLNLRNTITASWMPIGSNRVTSPNIKRLEYVIIWQYEKTDKYYWTPMGINDDLRTLETAVYAWAARPDDTEELDLTTNMYTLEVSAHGQHITLRTTTANGEPYAYAVQLNTRDGSFSISDDNDNVMEMVSETGRFHVKNFDDTEVTMEGRNITSLCQGVVAATAG